MTEKLTLEWCFKYPNAKINYKDKTWEIRSIDCMAEEVTLFYQIQNDVLVPQDYTTFAEVVSIEDCKLILRPLSSLTDEEEYQLELLDNYFDIINDTGLKVATGDVKFIDTLREWNVDIDGLQQRGVAVYE